MQSSSSKPLSALFADPFLKAAFERAERDQGDAAAAVIIPTPDLDGDDAVWRRPRAWHGAQHSEHANTGPLPDRLLLANVFRRVDLAA